jgi:Mn-dependent DtxR family transcriptional regulator
MQLLEPPVPLDAIQQDNDWTRGRMRHLVRLGCRQGLLICDARHQACHLSAQGKIEARRVTRNHRLWETYLLHYADVAPQHIHHNADQIEHVIEPHIVNELEELLAGREAGTLVPADPEQAPVPGGTRP